MLRLLVLGLALAGAGADVMASSKASSIARNATTVGDQLKNRTITSRLAIRDDYTYTPGVGRHKFHVRPVTWNEARKMCKEEGAHLAVINSFAEAQVIGRLHANARSQIRGSSDTKCAWIGVHSLFQAWDFVTIFDQSLGEAGYTEWDIGEPNDLGYERCGSTVVGYGNLNDIACSKLLAFTCELS